jgi:hypothetical protein
MHPIPPGPVARVDFGGNHVLELALEFFRVDRRYFLVTRVHRACVEVFSDRTGQNVANGGGGGKEIRVWQSKNSKGDLLAPL